MKSQCYRSGNTFIFTYFIENKSKNTTFFNLKPSFEKEKYINMDSAAVILFFENLNKSVLRFRHLMKKNS